MQRMGLIELITSGRGEGCTDVLRLVLLVSSYCVCVCTCVRMHVCVWVTGVCQCVCVCVCILCSFVSVDFNVCKQVLPDTQL